MTDFNKKSLLWPLFLLAPVFAYLVFLYVSIGENFIYTQWSVRDLIRSANLLNEFQVMGAEMDFGAGMRIPGGFMHYLWFLPLLVSSSPTVSFYFTVVLNLAGVFVLLRMVSRYWGNGTALVAGVLYLSSDVFHITVFRLWNPAFLPLFVILAYDFACRVFIDLRIKYAKWFFLTIALGVQMHMSALLLVLPFCTAWLIILPGKNKDESLGGFIKRQGRCMFFEACWCFLFFVFPFVPYLVSELSCGFMNSALLLQQEVMDYAYRVFSVHQWLAAVFRVFFLFVPFSSYDNCTYSWVLTVFGNFSVLLFAAGIVFVCFVLLRRMNKLSGFDVAALKRFGLFVLLLFGLTVLFCNCLDSFRLSDPRLSRYVFVLLPGLCVCAATALVYVCHVLRPVAGGMLCCFCILCFIVQGLSCDLARRYIYDEERSFKYLKNCRKSVEDFTGWDLDDMAGRVMLRRFNHASGSWTVADRLDFTSYERFCRGNDEFPGSGPVPGVVVLLNVIDLLGDNPLEHESLTDEHFAFEFFKQKIPGFLILDKKLVGRDVFVLYTHNQSRAFASMTTRYLLSAAEKKISEFTGQLDIKKACQLDAFDKTGKAYVFRFAHMLYGLIELSLNDSEVSARLHSNQLRGSSYNRGLFSEVMLSHPRLVFVSSVNPKIETVLEFAGGIVGRNGVLTPLSCRMLLEAGRYRVYFKAAGMDDFDKHYQAGLTLEKLESDKPAESIFLGEIDVG